VRNSLTGNYTLLDLHIACGLASFDGTATYVANNLFQLCSATYEMNIAFSQLLKLVPTQLQQLVI
jgi:hypothetical protein